ncbi:MAG: hypothetical protein DIU78_002005 [Pseudomonadota bacterium]|nr:MAG: hypothetical protein DIU78_07885 [Pseudomonadota bacterium]
MKAKATLGSGLRRRSREATGTAAVAASASWLALVAATALGVADVQRVRAEVSADPSDLGTTQSTADGEYRLIVQSYASDGVVDGVPAAHARPKASVQRSVTPDDLARGIAVDVVDLDASEDPTRVIVAWVERGPADLEFDALRARPSRDAYVGVARADGTSGRAEAHVVLTRRMG